MSEASGIGSWVPQFFYDLIARLVPGAIALGSVILAARGPRACWADVSGWMGKPSITLLILGVGMVAYVIGILSSGFWKLPTYWKVFRSTVQRDWKDVKGARGFFVFLVRFPFSVFAGRGTHGGEFAKKYDRIKFYSPATGARLSKLSAELSMARTLQFGWSVALGISFVMLYWTKDQWFERTLLACCAFWGILLLESFKVHIEEVQEGALANYSELVDHDVENRSRSGRGQ